jgi:hypothetical protein
MKKASKSSRNDRNRQAATGVQKHITSAVILGGVSYAPTEVVTILEDPISKADATTVASGAYHQAVATEKASVATADAVFEELRKEALIRFKGQPTVLADFGLTEPVRKVPTAATKAAAAAKRKAKQEAKKAAAQAAAAPPAAPATTTKS